MMVFRACIPFVVTLAVLPAARGESPLETAIDELVHKNGFAADGPGIAIHIYQPGKITFAKGYGKANLKTGGAVGPKTLFELASLTKPFTATAVLILIERNQIKIRDDVRRYLPELPVYDVTRAVRVHDLLYHTSGLPDYMKFENVAKKNGTYETNEDYLGEFAKQKAKFPQSFKPGSKYEYNNTNYMLLALIVERVSKKSFGEFLKDVVFDPAGMTNTFVYQTPKSPPKTYAEGCRPAVGYEKGEKGWEAGWGVPPDRSETMLTVGDGGIWSNLEDLAKWDAAMRANKLLDARMQQSAIRSGRTQDGELTGYGMGWSVYLSDKGQLNGFGHDGAWNGFRTSYYRYTVADRTTIVLSNRGDFDTDKFWYALNEAIESASQKK